MTSKWLITMVIVSPLRIGLWDPFQMGFSWLINGAYSPLTNWDDPPSSEGCPTNVTRHVKSWVGFHRFHGRTWKRKKDVYYDWVWQLSVFLNQIVGNDSQSLSHGFFSMGMEKTTRKPQGMHSGKHRNGKWIRIEDVFPSENGIFQPSYVSSPPEALQPTSAVGKNSRGCWHCLSLDASHTSAELLDVWEGCKR